MIWDLLATAQLFMPARFLWNSEASPAHAPEQGGQPREQMMKQPGQPPDQQPHLTPEFCFSSGTLSAFLRLSRSTVDDSITQNLDALITPADQGFDPKSTSERKLTWDANQPSPSSCNEFKNKVLFPAWQARAEALNYCGLVATSPDPNDPELALREVQNQRDRERIVDERLDPYSARFFSLEPRTQTLAALVRQERGVENIVRSQTWQVVQQRCAAPPETWQDAARLWSDRQRGSKD
ncbi:hypothetical protein CDD82_4188 [Ophiocordyceps australis]|uniref:Caffeine-induced death protein Cid2 n=1 Tax=Ophiocordyceps australis TaxID=1399860 RepID=A0A2C5Z812_9HYPO|nr:hypothetical protein CDD82_4188 [Ophiocordyceps australis]